MSFAHSFRLPASRNAKAVCVALVLLVASAVISSFHRQPRAWLAAETPVAFWAWRNQTPGSADVREAIDKTKARTIFLRAGQIDLEDGKLRRIRPVTGPLRRDHLRKFLREKRESFLELARDTSDRPLLVGNVVSHSLLMGLLAGLIWTAAAG